MKPNPLRRTAILLALLPLGAILSRFWVHPAISVPAMAVSQDVAPLILRPLDVATLLGLMLVAAFGIRALLPGEDED